MSVVLINIFVSHMQRTRDCRPKLKPYLEPRTYHYPDLWNWKIDEKYIFAEEKIQPKCDTDLPELTASSEVVYVHVTVNSCENSSSLISFRNLFAKVAGRISR